MKWKYFYHNPTPPTIRGLIKIHEISTTIRPIITRNWINAPAYKLPRLTVNNLETHIPLPSVSNVKITIQLIDNLLAIPHKDRMKKVKECKKNKLLKNGQNLHNCVNKPNLLQNCLRILTTKLISKLEILKKTY
jgi:hypothetical protein